MLRQGPKPDYAVIAKSGWSVSWEEVGLAWYEVNVAGAHSYVGSRHLLPYSNAIANAGKVVADLEEWFPIWTETHRSGLVAPRGWCLSSRAVGDGCPRSSPRPAESVSTCASALGHRLKTRTRP